MKPHSNSLMSARSLALLFTAVLLMTASLAAGTPAGIAPKPGFTPMAPSLPPSFEENRGQFARGIDFAGRLGDHVFEISATSNTFSTGRTECGDAETAIAMQLLGSNANAIPAGEERTPARVSYFIGSDRSKWVGGASTFTRVRYGDVYPGVDLVYHGSSGRIEYDFVVAPNADPRAVRLSFSGGSPTLTSSGELVVAGSGSEVRHHAPQAYQMRNGVRKDVSAKFELCDDIVTFRLGRYDRNLPLVIDPVLTFSRYLFFSDYDSVRDVEVDSIGNIYVMGTTRVPPTTTLVAGSAIGACVYVAKFDSTGTTPAYVVYFGADWDSPTPSSLAIDESGNAYVTGKTDESRFPTTAGAYMEYLPETPGPYGIQYGFITKINASGTSLVYSTLLGMDGFPRINDIAVDRDGNAYVTGGSAGMPVTPGALHATTGADNTYVAKLNATGSELLYAATFDGYGSGQGRAISVDGSGNALVAGINQGFSYIDQQGFISKLNATGTALIFSTYFSGGLSAFALDAEGHIYVAGEVYTGADFPATAGAYSATRSNGYDTYVARLDAAGTTLQYATLLSGDGDDRPSSLRVDKNGHVIVTGHTDSTDFPLALPLQQSPHENGDWFISKLDPTLSALEFSTILGPSENLCHGALTPEGDAVLAGDAEAGFWIRNHTLPGGMSHSVGDQAALAKIAFSGSHGFAIDSVFPAGSSTNLSGGRELVTLRGSGFQQNAMVLIGGVPLTWQYDLSVSSDGTAATFLTTEAHPAGASTISITNPDGATAVAPEPFTFSDLRVTGVSPSSGSTLGGTTLTIMGSGFDPDVRVTIGDDSFRILSVTPTTITCVTPPVPWAKTTGIDVHNHDGQTKWVTFTYTQAAAPTISGVLPNEGPSAGGTLVTINGTNFAEDPRVQFGDYWSKNVTRNSANQLVASTPPRGGGIVPVRVYNQDRSFAESANAFTYRGITSISPASGPIDGGTSVTITGTAFAAGDAVFFDGVAATGVTFVSAISITATTPAHAAGDVDVTISGAGHELYKLANGFHYWDHPPEITTVAPDSGRHEGGTAVTITGSAFRSGATVTFGGAPATNVVVVNDTTITCKTPPHEAAFVAVVVRDPDGQAGTSGTFKYTGISEVVPAQGNAGDAVVVKGQGFESGATVTFGGVPGSFVLVNSTTLSGNAPAHAPGHVDVVVTNPDSETFTKTNAFTYLYPAAPTVTGVSPNKGPTSGGTVITITGTNFVAGTTVKIATTPATNVIVNSPTQITATTAAHGAGTYGITVTLPDSQHAYVGTAFTYQAPPAISKVDPWSGPAEGGIRVHISGTSFQSGAQVKFGGSAATGVAVGSTEIACDAPPGVVGLADVTVTNPDGQSVTKTNWFRYLAPRPTVTNVTPNNGSENGGTPITITGTNFVSGAIVEIGSVGATNVAVNSPTQITATTPAHPPGNYGVSVILPDWQSETLRLGYTYWGPPEISNVSPLSGPMTGGTVVTITGTSFQTGAQVKFGATAATGVTVTPSTQITCITPPGTLGFVDVTVTNPDGESSTWTNAFQYLTPPVTVTSVTPSNGPISGGTILTITGTTFVSGATVKIGNVAATNVLVNSATQITATTPAQAAGTYGITVTLPDGQYAYIGTAFTYNGAPSVTSVSPSTGPANGGTTVTINGAAFVSGATVTFGGVAGTGVVFVSSTQLTAVTPGHAIGYVDVVVTNPDTQSGTGTSAFRYLPPAPTITSFAPTAAPTGTSVAITGTDFTGATAVSFNGTNAPGFVVSPAGTQITVNVPAVATTGKISVVTPSGTGVSAADFTVLPPGPTIVSVSPRSGSVNGGVLVTIHGTGFKAPVEVKFGGVTPAAYALIDSTTINATPHPHAAGAVDVTVRNYSDGTSATLTNGYVYTGAVDPNNDGRISASDIVMLVNYLFGKGPAPSGNGDANGDLVINVQDVFFLVNYLFANGRPPA